MRLFEKDRMQQSSVVVVEVDNHEILPKIGSLPRASVFHSSARIFTQRAKRRDSRPLALCGHREAMSKHGNWPQALPRGTRSSVKRSLESTIGLQV